VTFTGDTLKELEQIVTSRKLDFYDSLPEVKELIEQVFNLNPHSVHTLNKHKEGIYGIALDNLNLLYSLDE
jgi:ribosomal protein L23